MRQLSLSEIIPQRSTFKLSGLPDVELTLRPLSIEDREWALETFGGPAGIDAMFDKKDMVAITRLAFHLLEDKTPFLATEEDHVDEETGERTTRKVGGYRLLFRAICGLADHVTLSLALVRTLGISEAVQEELEKELSAAEKKSAPLTTPPTPKKSIGSKSSTSLKASTGSKQTAKSRKA